MKVLITGVSGAVGRHIIAELEDRHSLTLFARGPFESPHAVVNGDLRSIDQCRRAVENVEAIVHLGANSEPAPEAFEVNVQGTYHLLEAARENEVKRVIFASTNCVYGHCYRVSERPFPLDFLPINETHPCRPEDNYGLSKLLAEEMLATYSRTWGITTAAMRLNWVWGPKEIRWRREMTELDLAQFAPYFWAYVDARDVARAFRQALEEPDLPAYGSYNITAADHMANEETSELIHQFYRHITPGRELTGRASFFAWNVAHMAFGYEPLFSWQDNTIS